MSNTYNWKIEAMDVVPSVPNSNLTNYVVTSHWRVTGTDGKGHFADTYSTAAFTVDPKKPNFKPFDSLSEEEVISWTQASLGANQVSAIYTSIDTKIQDQITPAIITVQGPWNNSESV